MKLIQLLGIAGIAFLTTSTSHAQVIDKVIAQVEEDVVLQSELDRKMAQIKSQIIARGTAMPTEQVLKKEVLDALILENIQLQMASRAGMKISDAELQHFAGQIAKQSGMSLPEFRLKLAADGIGYEIFLSDLRNEIMVNRVRDGFVNQRIQISEKEIESIIQAIDSQKRIEYHLGHILIQVPEDSDEKTIKFYQEKANDLRKQVESGSDFSIIAANNSDGPNAQSGGDFGWHTEDSMPTLFSDVVYYMDKGATSSVIRSPSGFHILKLLDKRGEEQHMVYQVNSRHILIQPDVITSEEDAQALLTSVREQIMKGEKDFADVAKKYSKDPGSANIGGDLGWQSPNIYDPIFKDQITRLSVNEISLPFKSSFGWHIVQLLGERQEDQTKEMKQNQAAQVLRQRKFNEEVEAWLREIRDEAYVKKVVEEQS
ncbi:peptidylprolyl isomerase [Kangiella sp. HZ709]|uniref:peptidylprolyl isomerase n=1 Tax=Kangiella sp. HZ709 TaxID=2666328 RepID=UPI0012B14094|nr:peptidylprolyl isomerase [Kangiella sp. HZ709]MRX27615.1 SurA domain-containing protein [Kangiella sp. HZ709]